MGASMSFSNLQWWGWCIFVLTLMSFWTDAFRAALLIRHADKVKGKPGDRFEVGFGITSIGIAVTLYLLSTP